MAWIPPAHRRPADPDDKFSDSDGLSFRVTASPESAHRFRQYFAEWLNATISVDAERHGDIVLAVYEAVANAAEHAYSDGTHSPGRRFGTIEVRARTTRDESLEVTVTDAGRWKPGASSSPYRGRGLALISALSDASDVVGGPDGTSVTLSWHQRLSV